ncbi:MAG TPA: hypothetical protein VFG14_19215, partial [Chthoniobacteraceae bacterium]|nr:hypothetical protein [Chthoniobacteraceae bacterium]
MSPTRPLKPIRIACAAALLAAPFAPNARADRTFETWIQKFDSGVSNSPSVNAVAVDRRGDVAITGYTYTVGGKQVYYTAKYDGLSGARLWQRTYDGGASNGSSEANSVAMDSNGNVIVTGEADVTSISGDIVTIKYNSANGDDVWASPVIYDANDGTDVGVKVVVDSANNVIITGRSAGDGTNNDIYTAKYFGTNGGLDWEKRYNFPTNRSDEPVDLTVDSDNNAIVAGLADISSETKMVTLRYESAEGAETLNRTFFDNSDGSSFFGAKAVTVDQNDNIITTGLVPIAAGSYSLYTIKYDGTPGNQNNTPLWQKLFPLPVSGSTLPADVATDSAGNVIVAGSSEVDNLTDTIHFIKYAASNGAQLQERFTAAPGGDDVLTALEVDGA